MVISPRRFNPLKYFSRVPQCLNDNYQSEVNRGGVRLALWLVIGLVVFTHAYIGRPEEFQRGNDMYPFTLTDDYT